MATSFVLGMSVTSDYIALDLPAFGPGYLAMIKLYDSETKKYILEQYILEQRRATSAKMEWYPRNSRNGGRLFQAFR